MEFNAVPNVAKSAQIIRHRILKRRTAWHDSDGCLDQSQPHFRDHPSEQPAWEWVWMIAGLAAPQDWVKVCASSSPASDSIFERAHG
jgi:hypothetical protein